MKKIFLFGCLFLTVYSAVYSQSDSLLIQLDKTITDQQIFINEKYKRLEFLREDLKRTSAHDLLRQYEILSQLTGEYKTFIYDSAFSYATQMNRVAYRLNDNSKIADTKIKLGFILASSGLFNEALDTLRTIKSSLLPNNLRAQYYYLRARTAYDLCDFNRDDFYSVKYANQGHAYIDSALALTSADSQHYYLMNGLKKVRQRNMKEAQDAFEKLIYGFKLSDSDLAIAASTLSFIYFYSDQKEKSKEMLIRAAIADIRSCTKETLATLNLADMLFKEGDIEKAYKYVRIAMDDANFYGARQRKIQVAAVFPIIEGQQLSLVESRRKMLFLYSSIITALTLITIVFAIIVYKQFKNLREAKRVITKANAILTETNHQLNDANKIKEEYIWYYFNTTADYINKLDVLKKSLDLKLMTKKMEDIRMVVNNINIKKERDDLYHHFDEVFLKLFPDFVTVFNSFFKEEDRLVLKEGQLLNTELRIFALIRMGIHDNEKIAKILDYSVTTIYTYKTRIRSKSVLANDEFDKQIMAIRAI